MATKFLSAEWESKMKELLTAEFSTPSGLTTTFTQVVDDCPDGETHFMYYEVIKGILADFYVGVGEDEIPDSKFIARGPHRIFVDLIEGRLDGKAALVTGKLALEGNMAKALGLLGAYGKIEKSQRSIETEF